jgi:hypothetical protein
MIYLFLSASPLFADDACSAPPKAAYNPYSYTGEGPNSFNPYSLWKSDSHTYNPYSSTPDSDENIYHEPKNDSDEPGYWVVKTYKVNGWGNTDLQFDAHVDALMDDGRGTPNNWGQYLELHNRNKAPIYFNYTTYVLNDKLMPGESRRIQLGIYQPKGKAPIAYTVPLTIKYWVSTGTAPTSQPCKTWHDFYIAAASRQAVYDANKNLFHWQTYTLRFPGGSSGSYSQFAGPMRDTNTYSPNLKTYTWTNTGSTVVLIQCDVDQNKTSFVP